MRSAVTGLVLVLAVAGCGRDSTPEARPTGTTTPTTTERTQLLRFTYRPATGDVPTAVSLWFSGDAAGTLVAVRSSRVDATSGRLLQETAYGHGKYAIVDHVACKADDDVEPPTATTVTALIADSVGPIDAVRPTADVDDGQVLMRIVQPTADISSRVVTLLDSASKTPIARLDAISLTDATAADVAAPLRPLACTPSPSPP